METQVNIESAPARIEVNFTELDAALDDELGQYRDLVVTPDNIKSAKNQMAELNKLAKTLDDRRKAAVKEVSAPIREFEDQIKGLVAKCKDTRAEIQQQVNTYEDQARQQAEDLLFRYRGDQWGEQGVNAEFRQADVSDLAKLGSLTESGNLTKQARESVEARVQSDVALQRQTDARLANLEAASYRAGLHAPLERAHVESFLFAEDETYRSLLDNLIIREVERQSATEERAREKAEAEARETVAAEKADDAQAPPQSVPPDPAPQSNQAIDATDGKTTWTVTAAFQVQTPAGIDAEKVKAKVRERLTGAGIQDPDYMEVRENA